MKRPDFVDEAVPHVHVGDARLLGPAAVDLVEIGRIGARLGAALRRQPDPDHRNAGGLQRRDGGVDAPDIGRLPFLGVEFERAERARANLLGRAAAPAARRALRGLLLGVGVCGAACGAAAGFDCACAAALPAARRLRRGRAGDRRLLADRLAVVVADHHHDEFGLLGRDDLLRDLRPVDVAATVVADQAGIGAMLAHDADLGLLGECFFEPEREPVGHRIAHHHDVGRGLGLLLAPAPARANDRRRLALRSRSRYGRLSNGVPEAAAAIAHEEVA